MTCNCDEVHHVISYRPIPSAEGEQEKMVAQVNCDLCGSGWAFVTEPPPEIPTPPRDVIRITEQPPEPVTAPATPEDE